MRKLSVLIAFIISLLVNRAEAQYVTFGPKMSYTFGAGNGFTMGFEVSVLPKDETIPLVDGYTFDLTLYSWNRAAFNVGAEHFFSPLAQNTWLQTGVDVGPTLFFATKADIGFSAIVFGGFGFYPYYEFAMPFSQQPVYHSIGSYLKIPVTPVDFHI